MLEKLHQEVGCYVMTVIDVWDMYVGQEFLNAVRASNEGMICLKRTGKQAKVDPFILTINVPT